MALTTIGRGWRRLAAAAVLVATLAAGALAISRDREPGMHDPATVTAREAGATAIRTSATPLPSLVTERTRIAGGPPMGALRYPHSR
jgi:hypothetical protein